MAQVGTVEDPGGLEGECRAVLEAHWREEGFTVPNATTYPWQWLWDSCFHAVVWAHLGEGDRAVRELRNVFVHQHESGFVPHMSYWGHDVHADFWGRSDASSITQPPMYGHAAAELVRLGVDVPEDLLAACAAGLAHLLHWRSRIEGLVVVVHPWETGCDDSPRWDSWAHQPWDVAAWRERKGELVVAIERAPGRIPIGNSELRVAPVGFNALLAWNALELGTIIGDTALAADAADLVLAIEPRWDDSLATWTDAGDSADGSGRMRTADALLPLLVERREEVRTAVGEALLDPAGLGAPYGPWVVDQREPAFDPRAYWRGPAWPQITYLLWVAARRQGMGTLAATLGASLVDGARRSGFAEYWTADDASGLGAVPQSWSTLAWVVVSSEAGAPPDPQS